MRDRRYYTASIWLRLWRSGWWLAPGVGSLIVFALALTRVDAAFAGRAFAAYGGIYITSSLPWMRVVERTMPRVTDFAGAAICLFGAAVFERYARALHLDERQFRAAYDSAAAERRLRDMNKAGLALGVRGLPAFFLNGKRLVPPADERGYSGARDRRRQECRVNLRRTTVIILGFTFVLLTGCVEELMRHPQIARAIGDRCDAATIAAQVGASGRR